MSDLPVDGNNTCEVLTEFLHDVKCMGFFEISRCPFGQAYIQLDCILDRDDLVNLSSVLEMCISFFKNIMRVGTDASLP